MKTDKLLHFTIGLLIAQLAYVWIWFILLPILAGVGKELYDVKVKKSDFDKADMLATCAGCLPVLLILLL